MGSLSQPAVAQIGLMPPEDKVQDSTSSSILGSTDDVFKGELLVTLSSTPDRLSPVSDLQSTIGEIGMNGLVRAKENCAESSDIRTIFPERSMNGETDALGKIIAQQVPVISEKSSSVVDLLFEEGIMDSTTTVNGHSYNGVLETISENASSDATATLVDLELPVVVKNSVELFGDLLNENNVEIVVNGCNTSDSSEQKNLPDSFVNSSQDLVPANAQLGLNLNGDAHNGIVEPLDCNVDSVEKGETVKNEQPVDLLVDINRNSQSPNSISNGNSDILKTSAESLVAPRQADSDYTRCVGTRVILTPGNALEFVRGLTSGGQEVTTNKNETLDGQSLASGGANIPTTATPVDSLEYFVNGPVENEAEIESLPVQPLETVPEPAKGNSQDSLHSQDDSFKGEEVDSKTDGDSGFYCQDCETAICSACTDIEHHSHLTTHLQDAVEEQKEVLQALLEKAEAQVPVLKEAIDLVADMEAVLASRSAEAEDQINTCFDSLRDVLEQRRHLLLAELDDTYSRKQQILSHQRELLDACLSDLSSSCEFTEKALNHGSDTEVLIVKKQMSERLSEFSSMQIQKMPEENDYLVYNESDFMLVKKSLYNLGSVQSNSAVAFETTAAGEGLKQCIVGKQTVVTITTKDRKGDLVKVGHSVFKAEITSLTSPVSYITEVSDHKNGSYDLLYTVPREGQYQLSIRLFGQHIKGSPFRVKAYVEEESSSSDRPISKIPRTTGVRQHATKRTPSAKSGGSNRRSNPIEDDLILRVGNKGRNKGEFTNPQGICCTTTGRIVVADSNNQCLQSFNNSGECKLRFGIRGRSAGQLQRPTGVAVMPTGNYVVADYDNKWVSVFEPNGKFVNRIGVGKLLGPKGVAVDKNGHIIVVDNKASCVLIFQSNGKLISKFGSRGNQENQFAGPHFVAVNQKNQIVVSDFHNHCIKVFDSDGGFVMSFGSNGEGNGQFNAPTGVAVDAQDNILVADWGNSRIQVFDSNGSFLSYVNTMADPLYGPQGLSLTESGHIVVADSGNHCYKVYKYLQ